VNVAPGGKGPFYFLMYGLFGSLGLCNWHESGHWVVLGRVLPLLGKTMLT